ncbi:MAG: hypothetical protein DCC71_18430 [Proteobacteria bacterium]|nr:MAG: hypothetical protein DCC71_18430 [Pseudomonadota bacterium]
MIHSSCLCGDVAWDVDGPFQFLSHCHCSRCRKAHGVPFASYVMAPASGFALRGAQSRVEWQSSPGMKRCFCGRCGSTVPGDPEGELTFVPAGNFESDPGVRPVAHIFAASKAPWYEITDALPRFDAFPPGVDAAVLADRPHAHAGDGVHGGCNCGAVAFTLTAPPFLARYCHCARCRKARSAAHAANLLNRANEIRWDRGADRIASYKIPEAKFFMQCFCSTCGSKLPRVDPSRDYTITPLGSLDDDPGIRPTEHIFAASKAPWFDITDPLPQHPEAAPS